MSTDAQYTYKFRELSEEAKLKALEEAKIHFLTEDRWDADVGNDFGVNAKLMGIRVTHIHHSGEDSTEQGTAFYGHFTTDVASVEKVERLAFGSDELIEKYKGFVTKIKEACGDTVINGRINGSGEPPHRKQNMAFDYSYDLDEGEFQKAVSLMKIYHEIADMLHEELLEAKRESKSEDEIVISLESGEVDADFLESGELYLIQ